MTMFLSRDEIHELTQRTRYTAQIRALRAMGIEHRVRPDGSITVLRKHIESELGHDQKPSRTTRREEPNWDAL